LSALFRLRKTHRRLISDSKGFSSIVGAVFAVLVMISLISTVFVWSLQQNTLYNNAVTQTRQADVERSNEKTVVLNTTYTPYDDKVNVYAQIQNIGSSSIQFITVWLYLSNSTLWTNYNFSSLVNANVQSGSTYTLNVDLKATGVNPNSTYSLSSWLVTAKGNTVALQQTIISANNIIVSQTTMGIGALMMDFQNFTYYNVSQSGPPYTLTPPSGASGYLVQGAKGPPKGQFAFRVIITNLDQNQNSIILAAGSVLFSIFPTSTSAFQGTAWYIVNVNGTTISNSYTPVTLEYNRATPLYFASSIPSTYTPFGQATFTGTCPVNLALIGTIGGIPFGQNIPFVSISITS